MMYRMCRKGSPRHRSDRSGGTEEMTKLGVGRAWDEPAPPAARVSDREGRRPDGAAPVEWIACRRVQRERRGSGGSGASSQGGP
jgi:hypothetical protein